MSPASLDCPKIEIAYYNFMFRSVFFYLSLSFSLFLILYFSLLTYVYLYPSLSFFLIWAQSNWVLSNLNLRFGKLAIRTRVRTFANH